MLSLSILIPVYNEAHSIRAVLSRVVEAPADFFRDQSLSVSLIVVDDGSTDGSYEEIQAFAREHQEVSLSLLRHHCNTGKGAAVCTAIAQAQSDFSIIQDADFEYDPMDYPIMLAPLISGEADVVLGSRFMGNVARRPLGFWQAAANHMLSTLAGMAAGLAISDIETGYKAFRTSLAKTVPLRSKRFGLDPEIIIQFAKRHARVVEVPISYRGRTQEEGKKIRMKDAISGSASIFRTWLFSAAHVDPAADMLVAMSGARRFNRWMAETIRPWVKGDVIEIGAGIGNLTVLLSPGCRSYLATDTDEEHLSELRSRIAYSRNVTTERCEFTSAHDINPLRGSADCIVCLNVLEHVLDDQAGLRNICLCLRPGGRAVVLVPQGPQLFGSLDEVLDHKRRYTESELRHKMSEAGFEVTESLPFNRATWPGWYLNGTLLRRRTLSRFQLWSFDLLVPWFRRIDSKLPWPPNSLIAIGTAKDDAASQ